jgi:nucleotide-binding universal stress UspA family protein
VAGFLREHGVRATGEGLLRDSRRTATILQDRASDFGADLLVSGGYGRSRLGEWAFGGVTKSLLDQDARFVLLSH